MLGLYTAALMVDALYLQRIDTAEGFGIKCEARMNPGERRNRAR